MPSAELNVQVAFAAPGRVELVTSAAPKPGPGEVLIQAKKTLISTGTELLLLSGEGWSPLRHAGQRVPAVGYSHVGTAIAVGPGVDPAWVGQRVASRSVHARYATCLAEPTPGVWRSGVFAIPNSVTDEEATLFALGVTALNGLHRGALRAGERVTVVGVGLLGQLAVRVALRLGAAEILAVGRGAARLAFLPPVPTIRAVSGGVAAVDRSLRLADLVVDVTGDGAEAGPALELARKGGRMVMLGSSRGPSTIDLRVLLAEPSRTLIGADIEGLPARPEPGDDWCVAAAARQFFDELVPAMRAAPSLVTHRFAATQAEAAYALLRTAPATTLGCTLDW